MPKLLDDHIFSPDMRYQAHRLVISLPDEEPSLTGCHGVRSVWVRDMLRTYEGRAFIKPDGSLDLTPNTSYFSDRLESQGFTADGVEKDVYVDGQFFLHVLPVWAFCPLLTTGEDVRTPETYCEHKGASSWAVNNGWKAQAAFACQPGNENKVD